VRIHLQAYFYRFLRLLADIGSEPMFTALRAHFQEWRSVKEAQSIRFDNPSQPQRASSSVIADQRHADGVPVQPEAQVPSPPETTDARDHGNLDTSPKDYEGDDVVETHRDGAVPSLKGSETNTNTSGDVDVST
jgi:hypothetical protein